MAAGPSGQHRNCSAGGPGGISCTNTPDNHPKISIYQFPSDRDSTTEKGKKNIARHKVWKTFVRRHRPDFEPTKWSYLCSAHFEETCFAGNRELNWTLGRKILLTDDAVPTVYIAGAEAKVPPEFGGVAALTPRMKRKVNNFIYS